MVFKGGEPSTEVGFLSSDGSLENGSIVPIKYCDWTDVETVDGYTVKSSPNEEAAMAFASLAAERATDDLAKIEAAVTSGEGKYVPGADLTKTHAGSSSNDLVYFVFKDGSAQSFYALFVSSRCGDYADGKIQPLLYSHWRETREIADRTIYTTSNEEHALAVATALADQLNSGGAIEASPSTIEIDGRYAPRIDVQELVPTADGNDVAFRTGSKLVFFTASGTPSPVNGIRLNGDEISDEVVHLTKTWEMAEV